MSTKTPLQEWDAEFDRWNELAVRQGRTPNQAVRVAYRRTEDRRGLRPDGAETSGLDALEADLVALELTG